MFVFWSGFFRRITNNTIAMKLILRKLYNIHDMLLFCGIVISKSEKWNVKDEYNISILFVVRIRSKAMNHKNYSFWCSDLLCGSIVVSVWCGFHLSVKMKMNITCVVVCVKCPQQQKSQKKRMSVVFHSIIIVFMV